MPLFSTFTHNTHYTEQSGHINQAIRTNSSCVLFLGSSSNSDYPHCSRNRLYSNYYFMIPMKHPHVKKRNSSKKIRYSRFNQLECIFPVETVISCDMKWIFSSREYKAFKQKHFEFVLEQFHVLVILLKLVALILVE